MLVTGHRYTLSNLLGPVGLPLIKELTRFSAFLILAYFLFDLMPLDCSSDTPSIFSVMPKIVPSDLCIWN